MAPALDWKTGFEIELLAPRGFSRRDLAERVAVRRGDTVRRFFHPQSEPSKVEGRPVFENLTLGFAACSVRSSTKAAVRLPARSSSSALFCSTALSSIVPIQPAAAQSDSQSWDAFVGSRYNYCDAKLLGIVWGMTPEQGKVEIGYKVLHRLTSALESLLQESRDAGYECAWEDTGLGYDDAVQLAYVWDLDDPYQAKLSAAYHYTQGESGIVNSGLGR